MSYSKQRRIKEAVKIIEEHGIKKYVHQYINTHDKIHGLVKLFKNEQLSKYLDYINKDISNSEKLYFIINNYNDYQAKCKIESCGNSTEFISISKGYKVYCSKKCQNNNPILREIISKKQSDFQNNMTKEQRASINEKIRNTNNAKYGSDSPMGNKNVREKSRATFIAKYGVPHNFMRDDVREKSRNRYKELKHQELLDSINNLGYHLLDSSDNFNLKIKCTNNHIFNISRKFFMSRYKSIKGIPCTQCNKSHSNPEQFILDILKKHNIKYIHHDRTLIAPKEIDIYIPSIKTCIEVNGCYYHSELFKDKNYHIEKTINVDSTGNKLIHIWEDYILNSPDKIESMVLNCLGKSKRIYARKCEIREVNSKESSKFLEENHLQGKVNSSIKLGLYYNDELVALMTFGSLRKSLGQTHKEGHYELLRFCNKLNTTVVGGASKLFKYFLKNYNPIEVLSYAKRDWSKGGLYENLGFKFKGYTKPGFYWIKNNLRFHRFNFRKSMLVKEGYSPDLSANEIMISRGYLKVHDSGNLKYVYYGDVK